MPDVNTSVQRLLDEAAVRDLTARFAEAVTLADAESFRTLWAEDGEWVVRSPLDLRARGIDEIMSMLHNFWRGNDYFVQFAVPGPIQIEGDDASTRCFCHEAARGPNGRYYRNNGMWHDRLKRSGDGWVFTQRVYQFFWLDHSPFSGDTFMSFPQ